MGKVYESDVDAEEFIRSFREEPSGTASLKKKSVETEECTHKGNSATTPVASVENTAKPQKHGLPKEEIRFNETFVNNAEHSRTRLRYTPVEICPAYIQVFKKILLSYDPTERCSLKSYINNVLGEHITRFDGIIKKKINNNV